MSCTIENKKRKKKRSDKAPVIVFVMMPIFGWKSKFFSICKPVTMREQHTQLEYKVRNSLRYSNSLNNC